MTEKVCARTPCVFLAMPVMSETGSLETSEFCSEACALVFEWLARLAVADDNDETQRQFLMAYHVTALLSLRRNPGDMWATPENGPQTGVNGVGWHD
ncbi:hypothetical protein [Streptomyces sp. enrichment culture]|uniref:hypothetical protein n=1 Tax=Streptomyces sp. enrichment culture TaxID=1795815 RepID=UPI003F57BA5B